MILSIIGCGLKYFMIFQLESKPIVFHFVFHEIEVRAKRSSLLSTPRGYYSVLKASYNIPLVTRVLVELSSK